MEHHHWNGIDSVYRDIGSERLQPGGQRRLDFVPRQWIQWDWGGGVHPVYPVRRALSGHPGMHRRDGVQLQSGCCRGRRDVCLRAVRRLYLPVGPHEHRDIEWGGDGSTGDREWVGSSGQCQPDSGLHRGRGQLAGGSADCGHSTFWSVRGIWRLYLQHYSRLHANRDQQPMANLVDQPIQRDLYRDHRPE